MNASLHLSVILEIYLIRRVYIESFSIAIQYKQKVFIVLWE